jgi:hypothetical protein
MKQNILKAMYFGITVMIGLVIANAIKESGINIIFAIISGLVAAIVDFCISLICDMKKKRKEL